MGRAPHRELEIPVAFSCVARLFAAGALATVVRRMHPYEHLRIVTFEAMFIGYADAAERFAVAAEGRDPIAAYIPLFEALSWAYALDDRTGAHFVPDGKPLGLDWRKRIPNADIMAGVRYARNSVHHQWSDAMVLDEGPLRLPEALPAKFFEWVWRPADELAEPDKKPHPESEQIYREQLGDGPSGCVSMSSAACS